MRPRAIEAVVQSHDADYRLTALRSAAGNWLVPLLSVPPGKKVRMRIRARDVMIALHRPDAMSALNVVAAKVEEIGPKNGPAVDIKLNCSGEALVARLTLRSVEKLSLRVGISSLRDCEVCCVRPRRSWRCVAGLARFRC